MKQDRLMLYQLLILAGCLGCFRPLGEENVPVHVVVMAVGGLKGVAVLCTNSFT